MKRLKVRKKYKVSRVITLVVFLILFFTYILVSCYNRYVNPKVIEIAEMKLQKFTNSFLSNEIGYDILTDTYDEILIINKNEDGEILYVDYDLKESYRVLELVTNTLNDLIVNLEHGEYSGIKDKDFIALKNGLVLKMPLLIASDYAFLSNLGPHVYLPVNFVGTLLTNIKTKITDYGLNNALAELYVTVKITEELITPVTKNELVYEYDVLVASKIINGRVPEFYGGVIEAKSNALSIPID